MIDNRVIICGCGNDDCKIGVNFDASPNVMIFTDKLGDDTIMYLNDEIIDELIEKLKEYKTNKNG